MKDIATYSVLFVVACVVLVASAAGFVLRPIVWLVSQPFLFTACLLQVRKEQVKRVRVEESVRIFRGRK